MDDVIVYSKTLDEHFKRLDAVFQRLKEAGLKLKGSKCEFFLPRVTYLGHVVSADGVETDPEKTRVLKEWPVPKCLKDLRSFLGFTGYYRRFVPGYASIAKPLNDLLAGHPTNTKGKSKIWERFPCSVHVSFGVQLTYDQFQRVELNGKVLDHLAAPSSNQ